MIHITGKSAKTVSAGVSPILNQTNFIETRICHQHNISLSGNLMNCFILPGGYKFLLLHQKRILI